MTDNVSQLKALYEKAWSRRKLIATGAALAAAGAVGALGTDLRPDSVQADHILRTIIIKVADAKFTTVPDPANLPSYFTVEGKIAEVDGVTAAPGGVFECWGILVNADPLHTIVQQIFEPHDPGGFLLWGEGVEGGRHLWLKKVTGLPFSAYFPREPTGFYDETSGNLPQPLGNGELSFRFRIFKP